MKKLSVLILFGAIMLSPTTLKAQSFWKKVGKIGKEVLEAAANNSNTSSSSSNSGASNTCKTFPGLAVSDPIAYQFGKDAIVRFTVTNTTSSKKTLAISGDEEPNVDGQGHPYILDNNSKRYSSFLNVGNQGWYRTSDMGGNCELPYNVPIKFIVRIKNIDQKATSISILRLYGCYRESYSTRYCLDFKNIAIKETQNGIGKNVTFRHPDITFELVSCQRIEKDIVIKYRMKNISEYEYPIKFEGENLCYDIDGNQYRKFNMKLGNSTSTTLLPDLSIAGTITISNVPTNINLLTYLKTSLKISSEILSVEIRDLEITQ